jgi:hypothetical protein
MQIYRSFFRVGLYDTDEWPSVLKREEIVQIQIKRHLCCDRMNIQVDLNRVIAMCNVSLLVPHLSNCTVRTYNLSPYYARNGLIQANPLHTIIFIFIAIHKTPLAGGTDPAARQRPARPRTGQRTGRLAGRHASGPAATNGPPACARSPGPVPRGSRLPAETMASAAARPSGTGYERPGPQSTAKAARPGVDGAFLPRTAVGAAGRKRCERGPWQSHTPAERTVTA